MFKAIGISLLALAVGFGIWKAPDYFAPPAEAGIRMVERNSNSFIKTRSKEIDKHTFKDTEEYIYQDGDRKGEINPNAWFVTGMRAADDVRDDRRRTAAVRARANDRDASELSTEVPVDQDDWAPLREARVPSTITVLGNLTPAFYPGYETRTPDGIPWVPRRRSNDRTVLMDERNLDQPNEETGNLNEAIVRICEDRHGNGCTLGHANGSKAYLCVGPEFFEGGWIHGWYNGLPIQGKTDSRQGYFVRIKGSHGGFKYVITPDDPSKGLTEATDICRSHPGMLVVKKPTTPPTLVATK